MQTTANCTAASRILTMQGPVDMGCTPHEKDKSIFNNVIFEVKESELGTLGAQSLSAIDFARSQSSASRTGSKGAILNCHGRLSGC